MGDPECQVILPRLKTDILKIINNAINNKLKKIKIRWRKEKSMTIVLCTKGYPGNYKKNINIKNINKIKLYKNDFVFHAGTKYKDGMVVSDGGRVLNFTTIGNNLIQVRKNIIKLIKTLNWKEGFFRKDIGWRVINKK